MEERKLTQRLVYNVCFQYNVVSVPYNIDCILCMYMVENKFFKCERLLLTSKMT
jgi:hypothetical protein